MYMESPSNSPDGAVTSCFTDKEVELQKDRILPVDGSWGKHLKDFFLNFLVKGSCQAIHQWVNFFISTFIIRWLMTGCHWCVDCRHYLEIPVNVQMKIRIWETMEHG